MKFAREKVSFVMVRQLPVSFKVAVLSRQQP